MSEAMNPTNQVGPRSPTRTASPVGRAAPMPAAAPAVAQRPALVTFAAVMMLLAGGFALVWAFQEFSAARWLEANFTTYGYGQMSSYLWAWGIVDLVLAAVAIYAGVDVLRGGAFGFIIGLVMASVSAIRWFFYLPMAPWQAVTIIAIDVLVIYALASSVEYFANAQLR